MNNCNGSLGFTLAIGHTFASNIRKVNSRLYITAVFLLTCSGVFPQQLITVKEYIERYSDLAVEEMEKYRIPASITLAQGILESNSGNSALAREANNHFGIKCHKGWTGRTYHQDDDEKDECFRKYPSAEDSYRDHSEFLATRDRYKFLFDLEVTDYKGWAHGLKQAGYATNPRYPELLIKIIEENGLDELDNTSSQQIASKNPKSTHNSKLEKAGSIPNTQDSKLLSGPPDSFELIGRSETGRNIFLNNGVKFVFIREGDDCQTIAADFGIYTWQVYSYNELDRKNAHLNAGDKIYLQRKKRKSEYDFHIVKQGETVSAISQDYGVRMSVICKLNRVQPQSDLAEGKKIFFK